VGYNFFLVGESLYEPFLGTFWGGQGFFDPLNCPERSEGQFRGKKSRGPLKMSRIKLYESCPECSFGGIPRVPQLPRPRHTWIYYLLPAINNADMRLVSLFIVWLQRTCGRTQCTRLLWRLPISSAGATSQRYSSSQSPGEVRTICICPFLFLKGTWQWGGFSGVFA